MESHLEQVVFEIQQYSACLFKTEWERIKHHAKHGENTKHIVELPKKQIIDNKAV